MPSVTASVGAESMITMSNWLRTKRRNSLMRSDDRSSDGLGGIGPDGVRKRFSMSQRKMIFSASAPWVRKLTRPTLLAAWKTSCWRGLRRSPSTSRTFLPSCARTTARLPAVEVLPSEGTAEVTTITLSWRAEESSRAVRRFR